MAIKKLTRPCSVGRIMFSAHSIGTGTLFSNYNFPMYLVP